MQPSPLHNNPLRGAQKWTASLSRPDARTKFALQVLDGFESSAKGLIQSDSYAGAPKPKQKGIRVHSNDWAIGPQDLSPARGLVMTAVESWDKKENFTTVHYSGSKAQPKEIQYGEVFSRTVDSQGRLTSAEANQLQLFQQSYQESPKTKVLHFQVTHADGELAGCKEVLNIHVDKTKKQVQVEYLPWHQAD